MVSSSPTIVTDNHNRNHAIPAHMAWLVAAPTYNVSIAITTTAAATPLLDKIAPWAFSRHMPGNITRVADRFVCAITCKMTRLPTVLARLIVCTLNRDMALLEAVIAQPYVARWHWGSCAVSSTVPCLAASVADALIWTVSGHVTGLSTVPTQ